MIRKLLALRRPLANARLTAGELEDLQWSRLQALLGHASERVPYYRDRFAAAGIDPRNIGGLDELSRLPITRRSDLMAEPAERRIAEGVDPSRLQTSWTSGSSGKALAVFTDREESRERRAVFFRGLLAVGYSWHDRISFLGYMNSAKRGMHEKLGLFRTQVLPPTLNSEEQFRRLRDFDPTFLRFHPSSLQALVDNSGAPMGEWLHATRLAFGAEMLSPELRQRIDRELGGEIFNLYGAVECGRIAWECPTHEGLHVNSDQVILECIRDGRPVAAGEQGTAVVTSLNSFASPFIRYELGDAIRFTREPCSCGSAFPLIRDPEGRVNEMMLLPSGLRCPPFPAQMWVLETVAPSKQRIIQHRRDLIEIFLVAPSVPESELRKRLETAQPDFLEERLPFELHIVDQLPPLGSPFKDFECRVP